MQLFTGERVRLAAPAEADAETMVAWSRDSEFLTLLNDDPVRPWLARQVKEDLASGPKPDEVVFMIRTLDGDRTIGFTALWGFEWTHGEAWVSIGIGDRRDWGRGLGTDAMRVMLRYAFIELNLHRVSLFLFDYNRRALRSYEKAGFVAEGRLRQPIRRGGRRSDEIVMGALRDEWLLIR